MFTSSDVQNRIFGKYRGC